MFHLPVAFALRRTVSGRRARITIVDEDDAVADEDLVLDRDAGAYKRVTRDFAAAPDFRVALNLDERAQPGVVTNLAAVQIYVRRQPHALAHADVVRDARHLRNLALIGRCAHRSAAPSGTIKPPRRSE